MNGINLKKIYKQISSPFLSFKKKIFLINPDKNWQTLLALFMLGMLFILISKFILFYKISGDEFTLVGEGEEVSVETIDRGKLDDVLDKYRLKKDRFDFLKNNPPVIPEP